MMKNLLLIVSGLFICTFLFICVIFFGDNRCAHRINYILDHQDLTLHFEYFTIDSVLLNEFDSINKKLYNYKLLKKNAESDSIYLSEKVYLFRKNQWYDCVYGNKTIDSITYFPDRKYEVFIYTDYECINKRYVF